MCFRHITILLILITFIHINSIMCQIDNETNSPLQLQKFLEKTQTPTVREDLIPNHIFNMEHDNESSSTNSFLTPITEDISTAHTIYPTSSRMLVKEISEETQAFRINKDIPLIHKPQIDSNDFIFPNDESLNISTENSTIVNEESSTLPFISENLPTLHNNIDSASSHWALPESNQEITVQKCCPNGQVLQLGQPGESSICVESNEKFSLNIFCLNETHYWNCSKTDDDNIIINHHDPCNERKFFLDPQSDENDTFFLLINTSVYIRSSMEIINLDRYCLDTIITAEQTLNTVIICTPAPPVPIFHYMYGTGFIVSFVCLIVLAIYSYNNKHLEFKLLKIDMTGFAFSMGVFYLLTGVTIFCNQSFNFHISVILAFIQYYLKLTYYIWLGIFYYDFYQHNRKESKTPINTLTTIRISLACGIPLIFIFINFADNFKPALPNLYTEYEFSSSIYWPVFLFFMPIIILIIVNITFMSLVAYQRCKQPIILIFYSVIYRRLWFLIILITIFLFFDILQFSISNSGTQNQFFMFYNVIYCLQGCFLSAIFINKKSIQCNNISKQKDNGNIHEMEQLNCHQ